MLRIPHYPYRHRTVLCREGARSKGQVASSPARLSQPRFLHPARFGQVRAGSIPLRSARMAPKRRGSIRCGAAVDSQASLQRDGTWVQLELRRRRQSRFRGLGRSAKEDVGRLQETMGSSWGARAERRTDAARTYWAETITRDAAQTERSAQGASYQRGTPQEAQRPLPRSAEAEDLSASQGCAKDAGAHREGCRGSPRDETLRRSAREHASGVGATQGEACR